MFGDRDDGPIAGPRDGRRDGQLSVLFGTEGRSLVDDWSTHLLALQDDEGTDPGVLDGHFPGDRPARGSTDSSGSATGSGMFASASEEESGAGNDRGATDDEQTVDDEP